MGASSCSSMAVAILKRCLPSELFETIRTSISLFAYNLCEFGFEFQGISSALKKVSNYIIIKN
jgi:uncharacterized membrane protein required for colicin V production